MITKTDCCCQTLEILLRNVKSVEDLDLIESAIEDYQETFKIELIKYRREVKQMRAEYLERDTGRERITRRKTIKGVGYQGEV